MKSHSNANFLAASRNLLSREPAIFMRQSTLSQSSFVQSKDAAKSLLDKSDCICTFDHTPVNIHRNTASLVVFRHLLDRSSSQRIRDDKVNYIAMPRTQSRSTIRKVILKRKIKYTRVRSPTNASFVNIWNKFPPPTHVCFLKIHARSKVTVAYKMGALKISKQKAL